MKYIDAEKLIAEIEFAKSVYSNPQRVVHGVADVFRQDGRVIMCDDILKKIDSLQQEQGKSKKGCNDCPHCIDRKDQYGWHFKGCFGGQYKGKFIAEIDECPLKQEQPEVDLDFQVFSKEMDAVFNFPKEVTENTEEDPLNWEYAIARHFYELGLNARKKE